MWATFSDFPSPAGTHPKASVYALHHSRQAANKELSAPLTFTHPFLIVRQCSFGGGRTRQCQQSGLLNEHKARAGMLQQQCHGDSQGAIVHTGMVEHGTTAGSQNELANILFQLLLCHLASSEVTDVKRIFSALPSGSCLYNNRVTCRIWLRVIPRITSRILVTQTPKWKKAYKESFIGFGHYRHRVLKVGKGEWEMIYPYILHFFILQNSHEISRGKEKYMHASFQRV